MKNKSKKPLSNKEELQQRFNDAKAMYDLAQTELDLRIQEHGAMGLMQMYNSGPAIHPLVKAREQFMKEMQATFRLIQNEHTDTFDTSVDDLMDGP